MEHLSPNWVSDKIRSFRERLEKVLAIWIHEHIPIRAPDFWVIVSFLIISIFLCLTPNFVLNDEGEGGAFRYLYFLPVFGILILGCQLLGRIFFRQAESIIFFLAWPICLAAIFGLKDYQFQATAFISYLTLYALILTGFLGLTKIKNLKLAVFLLFMLCLCTLNIFSFLKNELTGFEMGAMLRPNRIVFLLLIPLLEFQVNPIPLFRSTMPIQFLFPLSLIYPIPTKSSYWIRDTENEALKVRGTLDVLLSLIFLWGYSQTLTIEWSRKDCTSVWNYGSLGLFTYIETYFLSCGTASFCVGIGRIIGFQLPDIYRMPLLASSPFERWRRWNTYDYEFFRSTLFLPFARRTKWILLPIFCTFLFTTLLHMQRSNPFNWIENGRPFLQTDVFRFFMAHALCVYLSLKLRFLGFDSNLRKGWGGVGLTWLLMIAIHTLKRW